MAQKKISLVVDASIARSAGETEHPTSSHCRQFLIKVRDKEFLLVFSPDIRAEWNKHQSKFALRWQSSMVARRRVNWINPDVRTDLQHRIGNTVEGEEEKQALIKDHHLLCAALETDERICALDDKMQKKLSRAAQTINEIRNIIWVNPDTNFDEIIEWIEENAPLSYKFCLGY